MRAWLAAAVVLFAVSVVEGGETVSDPFFRPGQELTSEDIERIVDQLQTQIVGGKDIQVRTFGDRVVVERTARRKRKRPEVILPMYQEMVTSPNGRGYVSSDGTAFELNDNSYTPYHAGSTAFFNNLLIGTRAGSYSSDDQGETWTLRANYSGPLVLHNDLLYRMRWAGYTADGINWTEYGVVRIQSPLSFKGYIYGRGDFSGAVNKLYRYTPPTTLTHVDTAPGTWIRCLWVFNDYLYHVDSSGNIRRSYDGSSWSAVTTLPSSYSDVRTGVSFKGDLYLGGYETGFNMLLIKSEDGLSFSEVLRVDGSAPTYLQVVGDRMYCDRDFSESGHWGYNSYTEDGAEWHVTTYDPTPTSGDLYFCPMIEGEDAVAGPGAHRS